MGTRGLLTVSSTVCCYFSYKQLFDGVANGVFNSLLVTNGVFNILL